ncbi:NAD(P)H-binding protein [Rhodovulum sp. DZ06]|uniref:NmrA family NAD(P)-binding protein n=1 Tax=Rhodovulum sp. DZ06 TaxID=3425126 RepID=UPI003D3564F3
MTAPTQTAAAANSPRPADFGPSDLTLVTGATGKTGARVAALLKARGMRVRAASRSASPAFDWNDPATWDAALVGVTRVYISFAPDLAVPGAADIIAAFTARAAAQGVERFVLLSGRGEEEAQVCERIVADAGPDWTVVRCAWFNQNFSEGPFAEMVHGGVIALPAGEVPEPFVDVDDIAEVAVAALTETGHAGEVYELTGPRLMSFPEVAAEISAALGREVAFVQIPRADFIAGARAAGVDEGMAWLMDYLFSTVLDGRNAHLADGVERALGRKARDFGDYARAVAAGPAWKMAG